MIFCLLGTNSCSPLKPFLSQILAIALEICLVPFSSITSSCIKCDVTLWSHFFLHFGFYVLNFFFYCPSALTLSDMQFFIENYIETVNQNRTEMIRKILKLDNFSFANFLYQFYEENLRCFLLQNLFQTDGETFHEPRSRAYWKICSLFQSSTTAPSRASHTDPY